jgi:hypothetical protein
VIVTGSTDRATIELLRESGLGWLIKPTTGAALRGAVAAALSAGPPVRN